MDGQVRHCKGIAHSPTEAQWRQAGPCGVALRLLLLAAFAAGLAVRLWGLSRPPLEFHPARQFMGATIARYHYLASLPDTPQWRLDIAERNLHNENMLEPHVLEGQAVLGYRLLGREALWIPRGLSVCYWLLGGWFLYYIGLRLFCRTSAVVAVLFYLSMPYAILASRSFQPDPLMVCLQLAGILALVRFAEHECAPRLLWAACLCAVAVFVKPVCLFVLLGAYGVSAIRRHGWLRTLASRYTWMLAGVLLLPVSYYVRKMLWDTGGSDLGAQAHGSIVPALLLTAAFWRGLVTMLARVVGFIPLILAVMGAVLAVERQPHRGTLAGIWLGYVAFVVTFTFHTHTHDYYHLQLLPIAALSLGPLATALLDRARQRGWLRLERLGLTLGIAAIMVGAGGVAVARWRQARGSMPACVKPAAKAAGALVGVPHKFLGYLWPESIGTASEVAAAQAAGRAVGHSQHTVFLGTDEGTSLTYLGEFSGVRWPSHGQRRKNALLHGTGAAAEPLLRGMLREHPELECFVVTDFGDLAQQPDLGQVLGTLPAVSRGPGHAVYSLRR